jgi:hypothetical protein
MAPPLPIAFPPPILPSCPRDGSRAGSPRRAAYFSEGHRLAVSRAGEVTVYDTADNEITGVSQHRGDGMGEIRFSSPCGDVPLGSLKIAR